jgi:leader peptidase (prepilin peptidase)/N-methyltransferase
LPDWLAYIPSAFCLIFVFILGAIVGSFLNVCIARLPLEKSFIWPGSRCSHCLQPIRWYDNVPLISYWVLRGKCRACGEPFSIRYFIIELLTALGFVALFYLEIFENVHELDILKAQVVPGFPPWQGLVVFSFHAILFCFLLVASLCDIDRQTIPLSLTVTGTIIGLVGAVLFPWPWPHSPANAVIPPGMPWRRPGVVMKPGLYPWPVWALPDVPWLQPGGNWQTGLATGLAGALAGTLLLRGVRFLFGLGMGSEYMEEAPESEEGPTSWFAGRWFSWIGRVGGKALGLGDADLMMMAGAFLGWQPVLVAFFMAVLPGVVMGLSQAAVKGHTTLPFGPALAIGVMITSLSWRNIGPQVQFFFFDGPLVLAFAGGCCVLMIGGGFLIRFIRFLRE